MKTILYFKTNEFNTLRPSTKFVTLSILATSYDNSTDERLYQISSDIYDKDQLEKRYPSVTWLDESEALDLGKILQPERLIEDYFDDETGGDYYFEFELPDNDFIKLAKVKMTDLKVPRGLEDLYDKLKEKGVLTDTDIPTLEQEVSEKKSRRNKL